MNRAWLAAAARSVSLSALIGSALLPHPTSAAAQTLMDPDLSVTTVVSGLSQSIAMAFIGPNDILVTEKASGQVQRITNWHRDRSRPRSGGELGQRTRPARHRPAP